MKRNIYAIGYGVLSVVATVALGLIQRITREKSSEESDKIEWFHKYLDAQRNLEMTQKKLTEAVRLKDKYKDLLIEVCKKHKGEHHETVEDSADM